MIDDGELQTFLIGKRGIRISDQEKQRWEGQNANRTATEISPSENAKAMPLPTTAMRMISAAARELGVPFADMDAAKAALDRFAEAQRAVAKQQAAHTIGDLWRLWMAERKADKLRNDIYEANWVSLRPAFASRSPDLLIAQDFRDYAQARFEAGRAAWTVHTELTRLSACFK